jgi:hypothetical protein
MSGKGVSPISSEAMILKIASIITDGFEKIAQQIRLEIAPFEPITYKGTLVGRVHRVLDTVEFVPAESLTIKADDKAIGWLQREVLEKIKEKHGWNYQIVISKGVLDRVVIYHDLVKERVDELKNPFGWAFAAAAGLISEEPKRSEEQRAKPRAISLEDAKKMFPNELLGKIDLEVSGSHIIVKPKQFLGSKLFSTLADIARNKLGGEYVSAGRDSHFRIPIEATQK